MGKKSREKREKRVERERIPLDSGFVFPVWDIVQNGVYVYPAVNEDGSRKRTQIAIRGYNEDGTLDESSVEYAEVMDSGPGWIEINPIAHPTPQYFLREVYEDGDDD